MLTNRPLNTALASSLVALSAATGFAIPRSPCEQKPDVCCDMPKPGPFAFAYPVDKDLACPLDFFFHVDALAWQAKEDGLEFAIADNNGSTSSVLGGEVWGFSTNNNDYGYNPGVRVGLGFYLNHDAWGLQFDWTWVNITNYKEESVSAGGVAYALWNLPTIAAAGQPCVSATARWDAHYDTLDARMMKSYHVSRYLTMTPHFGVRAAWIDQHYGAHYSGTFGTQLGEVFHADNDFWGFGGRMGVDTQWILAKGWHLFANASGSLLFGQFKVNETLQNPNGFDTDFDFYQNVPNVDMAIGIGWSTRFNQNRYAVGLEASYEFTQWWDQNNMRRFLDSSVLSVNDTVSRGNLSLNGFALRLQFDI